VTDPFVAEIRIFGFNFAPSGWAQCNGQLLPISQNTALFSLLGTTYGGDGKSTFALPDLGGSVPLQHGQGPGLSEYWPGQMGGSETVTLLESEIPSHTHTLRASTDASDTPLPGGNVLARSVAGNGYRAAATGLVNMAPESLAPAGGDQPHNNLGPYLVLNFCIALQGVFPPRW
jgi:microcystin-dependent protein